MSTDIDEDRYHETTKPLDANAYDFEIVYGSAYLSPDDLPPGKVVPVQITSCAPVSLYCKGKTNIKWVLECKGAKKKVAINKTSAKALAKAFGKDGPKMWAGKSITVEQGRVNGKKAVLCKPARQAPASQPKRSEANGSDPEAKGGQRSGLKPDTSPAASVPSAPDDRMIDKLNRCKEATKLTGLELAGCAREVSGWVASDWVDSWCFDNSVEPTWETLGDKLCREFVAAAADEMVPH